VRADEELRKVTDASIVPERQRSQSPEQ